MFELTHFLKCGYIDFAQVLRELYSRSSACMVGLGGETYNGTQGGGGGGGPGGNGMLQKVWNKKTHSNVDNTSSDYLYVSNHESTLHSNTMGCFARLLNSLEREMAAVFVSAMRAKPTLKHISLFVGLDQTHRNTYISC